WSSTEVAVGVLPACGRRRATCSPVVASAVRIFSSTVRVLSGTEASSTGRAVAAGSGRFAAAPTPPRVTTPTPAAAASASTGPPSPVPSTTARAARAARPPRASGAPKRTSGDRRAGPTAREAGERTVPCRGFSTGPHRSRRSAVAFQGRSWSPGATLGVPGPEEPEEAEESERGAGEGAKGSGNRLVPLVGGSADGSCCAFTGSRCPPRDGDEARPSGAGDPGPAAARYPGERLVQAYRQAIAQHWASADSSPGARSARGRPSLPRPG